MNYEWCEAKHFPTTINIAIWAMLPIWAIGPDWLLVVAVRGAAARFGDSKHSIGQQCLRND